MFCYVILHYQDFSLTCESVLRIRTHFPESAIVIVDNCSPNGSGKLLVEKYASDERVNVILRATNGGFACGNNSGFCFAKEKYRPDYIVVMNNDVFVDDPKFEGEIVSFMLSNSIDVCGPDVTNPNGNHQNPLATKSLSNREIKGAIFRGWINLVLLRLPIFNNVITKRYNRQHSTPKEKINVSITNCVLHGSCVIYGPKYVRQEDFAFVPVTFMYGEESILYDYCVFKKYKIAYDPNPIVLHLEGQSTRKAHESDRRRILFRYRETIRSLERQLEERKKYAN